MSLEDVLLRGSKNVGEPYSLLLNYTNNLPRTSRLTYYYPKIFRILKKLKIMVRD